MAKKKKQPQSYPSWFKHIWWAVPLLAMLVYIPSFNADFTLDDIPIIKENDLIRSAGNLPKLWSTHYWAGKIDASDTGLYRPLTVTTYAIQYLMTGEYAAPFHVLNILLHALVCFVLMKYVNLLFRDFRVTLLAGVLFAIHPVHTEAVSGIVGRAEILAALFILLAGISFHHYRIQGSIKWLVCLIVATATAITSKEHGFMIIFILGLQEVIYYYNQKKQIKDRSRLWMALASVFIVSLGLWGIRNSIVGPSKPHEQWLNVDAGDRMATSIRTTMEYLCLHVFPLDLSADYWTDKVGIVGWTDGKVLIAFLISLGLFVTAIWKFKPIRSFAWGILFFYLTLAPVSNIFFAAGFLKAERILYIPSIGLITAIAALIIKLFELRKTRIWAWVLIGILFVFFTIRTFIRAADWKNNYTLAEATLKESPNSPRFNNMMGLELRAKNRNEEALKAFEKAVQSNPNHVPALVNLGTEYKNANRLEEAASTLEKALNIDPGTMMTYVNLMAVYRDMKQYDKNLEIALLALERYPQSAPVLWNAGNAYQLKGNMEKAEELRGKARQINPEIMR